MTPFTEQGAFLKPYLPKQSYLWPAWLGCLSWALQDAATMQAFRSETGNNWRPGRTGLDRMIDEATGVEKDFLAQFAQ